MCLRLPALVVAFLALWAQALTADEHEKWEGFRTAAEVKLPFHRFLTDSVVMIETAGVFGDRAPSEEPDEWVDTGVVAVTEPAGAAQDSRGFQIETCKRAGLRRCPVMKRSTFGTGFILNGDTLVTCRHGFHNWLAWATRGNGRPLDGVLVPLRIRNHAGKLIYDSSQAAPERFVRLAFFNADLRINRPVDTASSYPTPLIAFNAKASDYAAFKSPVALTPAHVPRLLRGADELPAGSEIYLFGYPEENGNRKKKPARLRKLSGSHGRLLSRIPERGSIRASNYSNMGMSGGPMLTPEGSILGVSCGAFGMEQQLTDPSHVNATGILLDDEHLLDVWSRLKF